MWNLAKSCVLTAVVLANYIIAAASHALPSAYLWWVDEKDSPASSSSICIQHCPSMPVISAVRMGVYLQSSNNY